MLIRLAGHFINNPNHIDKLICIKGLPEEWVFRKTKHGKELMPPWQPDVDANIPKDIRELCEPTEITVVFPPIEKGRDSVIEQRTILGLKFEFMTEPGRELWEKIERYMEKMTPRDLRVPEPALVAPDQKSGFNPHIARRTVRGSLELFPTEIPVVDLRLPVASAEVSTTTSSGPTTVTMGPQTTVAVTQPATTTTAFPFVCECGKGFSLKGPYAMHRKKHSVKEKVGA